MKVVEHLENAKNPLISVEIIPPRRGGSAAKIHDAIESIKHFNPPFIDVTAHSAEVQWDEQPDGSFKKRIRRKAPGTFGLCAAIKYKYDIDPVPHVLCNGFTKEETEDALIELNYLGIENVLAIRGDGKIKKTDDNRTINRYASDLVEQLNELKDGTYQQELSNPTPMDFCIGVSYYPEKHFESPNKKFDIDILRQKVEKGAQYGVSQMFFNNEHYYDYKAAVEKAGIDIPLIPGLKIITNKRQLSSIPRAFFIEIPEELVDRMMNAKTKDEELEVGVEWAYRQSIDLLEKGNKSLHYYIMQNTKPFLMLMDKLKGKL